MGDSYTPPVRSNFPIFCPWLVLGLAYELVSVPGLPSHILRQHIPRHTTDSALCLLLTGPPTHAPDPRPLQSSGADPERPALIGRLLISPPPERAQEVGRARARAALSRGEAPVTVVRAPGRGVLELCRDSFSLEAPPVPSPASRTAGQWPRTPPAVPGCRSPENTGLKGQRRAATSTCAPGNRPGRPEEARLPQPAGPCDWWRRRDCWTSLVPPSPGQNGAGEPLLRTAPCLSMWGR
ncbi:hypothetical protein NN561_003628 [Cricetulus griseus]